MLLAMTEEHVVLTGWQSITRRGLAVWLFSTSCRPATPSSEPNAEFALGFWVWSFLAAPAPVPETLILNAPGAFVGHMLDTWPDPAYRFPSAVRERYVRQFTDMDRLRAICAQYREAASTDREMDLADRVRRPIGCPTLVLWSGSGAVGQWYEPLDVWSRWAGDVAGHALPGGHFCPEEVPEVIAAELTTFFMAG